MAYPEEVTQRSFDGRVEFTVPIHPEDKFSAVKRLCGHCNPDVMNGSRSWDFSEDHCLAWENSETVFVPSTAVKRRNSSALKVLDTCEFLQ
jgi:hypothetical protein